MPGDLTSRKDSRLKTPLHFCHARHHPDLQAAYNAAIRENPANAAITPSYLTENEPHSDRQPRLVGSFTKYWARGRTLRIRFLGIAPLFLQNVFFETACKWLPHVNLKFTLVTSGDAEIRIDLSQNLNASAVGTDALLAFKRQDVATLYFDLPNLFDTQKLITAQGRSFAQFELGDFLSDNFERVVLHEFGHVLGAEHEHQHPNANIPWDEQKVIQAYAAKGYSEQTVRKEVLDRYEAADFSYFEYDPKSVMHYNVAQDETQGDFTIDNSGLGLSDKDIEFMSTVYGDRQNSRGPLT